MTKSEGKAEVIDLKGLLARDEDFVPAAVEALVQAAIAAVRGCRRGTFSSATAPNRAPLTLPLIRDSRSHGQAQH